MLFNHTFVLCFGAATCPRHRSGYWPRHVHERMTVIDGADIDRSLAVRLGKDAAALLGIVLPNATRAERKLHQERQRQRKTPDWLQIVRHRVLALLASLEVIKIAQTAGLPSVLFLEGDVRPVPSNALLANDIQELRSYLSLHPWQVIRPSGYFYDFAQYRARGGAATCPQRCVCKPTGLRRGCMVPRAPVVREAGKANADWLQGRCDVRDTVGFAAHARTYAAFRALRRKSLHAFARISAMLSGALPTNSSFGWPVETFDKSFPWFDKWLPARFDSLYLLPSIMVQQVRQGDQMTSRLFMRKCMQHEQPKGKSM